MTLAEYCSKHDIMLHHTTNPKTGNVRQYFVIDGNMSIDVRAGLWQVKDWQVTSVVGGSIWFIPR